MASVVIVRQRSRAGKQEGLLFRTLFGMIGKEAGRKRIRGSGGDKLRTHGIAGMRRRGRVYSERYGSVRKFPHAGHYAGTVLRLRSEYFQECPRVHGTPGFHQESIIAVADIGHCGHPAIPEGIYPLRCRSLFIFCRGEIPQFVYLVYESGHPRSLAELSPEMGKLEVAMRIDKAGNYDALSEIRLRLRVMAFAHGGNGPIVIKLHIAVPYRLHVFPVVNVLCCYSVHFISFFLSGSPAGGTLPS